MRTTVTLASGAIQPSFISNKNFNVSGGIFTSEETTTALSEICLFDAFFEILVVVTEDRDQLVKE